MGESTVKPLSVILLVGSLALVLPGCTQHKVETESKVETKSEVEIKPIRIEPIHMTLDVNINIKIDRQLDDFFSFEDELAPKK